MVFGGRTSTDFLEGNVDKDEDYSQSTGHRAKFTKFMPFSCFMKESYTSSSAKGGDDECEECEQKWRGGCKVGYVYLEKEIGDTNLTTKRKRHRFIELVGEENQEDEKRNNEEAVTQSGVG